MLLSSNLYKNDAFWAWEICSSSDFYPRNSDAPSSESLLSYGFTEIVGQRSWFHHLLLWVFSGSSPEFFTGTMGNPLGIHGRIWEITIKIPLSPSDHPMG